MLHELFHVLLHCFSSVLISHSQKTSSIPNVVKLFYDFEIVSIRLFSLVLFP